MQGDVDFADRVNPYLVFKQPVVEGLDVFWAQIPNFDLTEVGNKICSDKLFIVLPGAAAFGGFRTGSQPVRKSSRRLSCWLGSSHHQSGRGSFLTIPGTHAVS